jgi:protein TonB
MRRRTILFAALALATGIAIAADAAKKGAKPIMNAYFASGFADTAYQQQAVDKVLKVWAPGALPPAGKLTVLRSKIGRDGKLKELYFHQKTEQKAWDDAAEAAVAKAAPFPPLPAAYPHPTLEVHWHFQAK